MSLDSGTISFRSSVSNSKTNIKYEHNHTVVTTFHHSLIKNRLGDQSVLFSSVHVLTHYNTKRMVISNASSSRKENCTLQKS